MHTRLDKGSEKNPQYIPTKLQYFSPFKINGTRFKRFIILEETRKELILLKLSILIKD